MAGNKVEIDPFARPARISSEISEGDIVRCILPTDIRKDGNRTPVPRNAVVLGVRINKDTHYPSDLYVVRGAFVTNSYNPNVDISLSSNECTIERQNGRNFIIKPGRIDMVPLFADFFERGIVEKVGSISPKSFGQVRDALRWAQACEETRQSSLFHDPVVDSWVVPGLLNNAFHQAGSLTENLQWSCPPEADCEKIRENLWGSFSAEASGDAANDDGGEERGASSSPNEEMDLSYLAPPRKTKAQKRDSRKKKRSQEHKRAMSPY